MRINQAFENELLAAIAGTPSEEKHLSKDALVRAKADVAQKKATLANIMYGMVRSGRDPYSSPAMMEAKRNFDLAAGHYCYEIYERNKSLTVKIVPDASLLKCPTRTKLSEVLEKHPIRKSTEERELQPLPLIGERVNPDNILKESPTGKPTSISEEQAAALFTAEMLTQISPYIDKALRENIPLDDLNKYFGELRALMISKGQSESGDITLAVETEFHSTMLHRSRELFEAQLIKEFKLEVKPEFMFPTLAAAAIANGEDRDDRRDPAILNNDLLIHPTISPSTSPLGTQLYLPLLPDPRFAARQTKALNNLGLKSAENNGVSIAELQKALAKFGPKDPKVIEFFQCSGLTPEARERLEKLAGSQHEIEEYAEIENLRRQPLNINRQESKGTAGDAKKAMDDLERIKQHNEQIKSLPVGSDQFSGVTAAAVSAAKSVLDEKNELTPEGLKGKISIPVTEASPKDDKLASPAGEAAQIAAEEGIKLAEEHLAQSPGAELSLWMVDNSLAISSHLLNMDDEKFRSEINFSDLPNTDVRIDPGKEKVVADAAALAKKNDYCRKLMESGEESGVIKAKGFVAKTAALARVSMDALLNGRVKQPLAERVTKNLVEHFLQYGTISADEIKNQISSIGAEYTGVEGSGDLLAASIDVQQSVLMSLEITTGFEKSKETINAVKKTNAQSLKSVAFSEKLAQRMSDKIHKQYLEDKKVDNGIVQGIIKIEIERANYVMSEISKGEYKVPDMNGLVNASQSEVWKKSLLEITNLYKANGDIDKDEVTQILTTNLKPKLPNEILAIETLADSIIRQKDDAAEQFDNLTPWGRENFVLNVEPKIPVPSDIDINEYKIPAIYASLADKAMQQGVSAAIKVAHKDITGVDAEIEKGQKAGNSSEEISLSVSKMMPPGSNFVAPIAAAALIAQDDKDREKILRKRYAHHQPRLSKATTSAKNAAIASAAVKAKIPAYVAAPMAKVIAGKDLKGENVINDTVDRVNGAETVYNLASKIENLGLDAKRISPELHADIQDRLVNHYLSEGVLTNDTALNIVNQAIVDENQRQKKSNKDYIDITESTACQNFTGFRGNMLHHITSNIENLGLDEKQISHALRAEIHDRLGDYYLREGDINDDKALEIVNQVIAEENKPRPVDDKISSSTGCRMFTGTPPLPLSPTDRAAVKASLPLEIYKALVLTTSSKARIDAEKAHPKEAKDPKSNLREVSAAVVATAIASGLTQEQALKLAEKLTAQYVTDGNFDKMDVAAFKAEIVKVASGIDNVKLTRIAKLISRGANAASKLPDSKDADPVYAGTSIAADVYPLFDKPKEAGAIAAAIAEARNGSPTAIDKAALYAQGVCGKVSQKSLSMASGAVAAITAHKRVNQGFAYRDLDEDYHDADTRLVTERTGGAVGFINTEDEYKELAEEVTQRTITNITDVNSFRTDLYSGDAKAHALVLRNLGKASTISTQVGLTALKLGISHYAARDLALEMANPHVMAHGINTFQSSIEISLAVSRVRESLHAFRAINNLSDQKILNFDQRERDAKTEGSVPGILRNFKPREALTAKEVSERANLAYQKAKASFLRNSKSPTEEEKAAAEIVGTLAGEKIYQEALKTRKFTSPEALAKVASHAERLSDSAVALLANYRKNFIARNPTVAGVPPVPVKIPKETVAELAAAARSGELIDKGLTAANDFDAKKKLDRDYKHNSSAHKAELAATAVKAMAIAAGFSDDDAKEAGERARKVVENTSDPAEAGALTASLISPAKPEFSQAIAAVVTDITSPDTYSEGDKAQAIAKAVRATEIGKDRALRDDGKPGLQPISDDEFRKKQDALAAKMAALNEEERLGMLRDKWGVTDALKEAHLKSTKLDAHNVGEWRMTLPSYGVATQEKSLKDMPEMQKYVQALKSCDGYVTEATLRQAVEKFNAWYKQNNKSSAVRSLTGKYQSLPTDKKLSVRDSGDELSVSLNGLSLKEIDKFMELFVECSMAAKASAKDSEEHHAATRNRAEPTPPITMQSLSS